MHFGPHYMVLFLRHAPPAVELCTGVDRAMVDRALAITRRYGARWGEVHESRCIAAPTPGEVRVQVSALPDFARDADTDADTGARRAVTATATDSSWFATTSIVTLFVADDPKLLAHELSHAQGIGHVCEHDSDRATPECGSGPTPYPDTRYWNGMRVYPEDAYEDLDLEGHLMHPDSGSQGLDVVGMRWAVKRIYAEGS